MHKNIHYSKLHVHVSDDTNHIRSVLFFMHLILTMEDTKYLKYQDSCCYILILFINMYTEILLELKHSGPFNPGELGRKFTAAQASVFCGGMKDSSTHRPDQS